MFAYKIIIQSLTCPLLKSWRSYFCFCDRLIYIIKQHHRKYVYFAVMFAMCIDACYINYQETKNNITGLI